MTEKNYLQNEFKCISCGGIMKINLKEDSDDFYKNEAKEMIDKELCGVCIAYQDKISN